MNRRKICRWMWILMVVLVLAWAAMLVWEYSRYSTTLNSAPFRLFVLVLSLEFLPGLLIAGGVLLYQKKKIKEEEEKL